MQMDIKKILVTGANGQLGNELRLMSENFPQFEYLFTDVAELDICNAEAVNAFVEQNKVDAIIILILIRWSQVLSLSVLSMVLILPKRFVARLWQCRKDI